jgi:hypothetical protein
MQFDGPLRPEGAAYGLSTFLSGRQSAVALVHGAASRFDAGASIRDPLDSGVAFINDVTPLWTVACRAGSRVRAHAPIRDPA